MRCNVYARLRNSVQRPGTCAGATHGAVYDGKCWRQEHNRSRQLTTLVRSLETGSPGVARVVAESHWWREAYHTELWKRFLSSLASVMTITVFLVLLQIFSWMTSNMNNFFTQRGLEEHQRPRYSKKHYDRVRKYVLFRLKKTLFHVFNRHFKNVKSCQQSLVISPSKWVHNFTLNFFYHMLLSVSIAMVCWITHPCRIDWVVCKITYIFYVLNVFKIKRVTFDVFKLLHAFSRTLIMTFKQ